MKILHINTYPWGGAFNGTYRLHRALLSKGVDSKILVNHKPVDTNLEGVYVYDKPEVKANYFNRISTKLGFPSTFIQKKYFYTSQKPSDYEIITFPFSDYDITNSIHYQEADIINLHWIGNFLDYKSFFKKVNKPIVWTLRDLAPLQGVFHYEEDKIKNFTSFGDIDSRFTSLKINAVKNTRSPVYVIGISNWVTNQSRDNKIFKNFPHGTISNCLNIHDYELLSKTEAKRKLNIDSDKITLSFASDDVLNSRKGFDLLYEAITQLPLLDKLEVLTFGGGNAPVFPINVVHRHFGHLKKKDINTVLCATDALIFPTREEALGNIMLEAMACGTPVIGTKVGGLTDVIRPGFNGMFLDSVSSESLYKTILNFIEIRENFSGEAIRDFIKDNYSEEYIADQYIKLYGALLK
jgi:glycosyltransferase involved in cell wall biosynthesis